jgi:lipoprotein signal peptidase
MYLWAINQTNAEHWKNNIFIRINIILNTGISYSLFADNPIVVYSLQ